MSAEFLLTVGRPSDSASQIDFIDLEAQVSCRGYAGRTAFVLARRDLAAYLADLQALREARAFACQLIGGWEAAEERLRLKLTPAGRSGKFHATIQIATNGPRTDQWQRVETDFICSAEDLSSFLTDLEMLSEAGAATTARLAGDADAIA